MANKKILIIDDEEDLCLLLKDYFKRKNFDVYISHDLDEGRSVLNQIVPDVVVLDNNLPGGTGWDTASFIADKFPQIYILLISAYKSSLPMLREGALLGIIEKPVSFVALDRVLRKLYN